MTDREDDPRTRVTGPASGAAAGGGHHDSHALPPAFRLGEFEIQGILGEGGFSIVYRAWDHSLDREVALKEYMPESLASRSNHTQVHPRSERHRDTYEAGLKSFINEAKLLAQFDHPSLVKVYRFWEAHGTAYLIMPLYDGVTVKDTVRAMAQPPDEAWLRTLLDPLTKALSVIHAEQCFHRDIAPDNVLLLAGTGRPLLLDFGAARRVISDRTQALTVILKPGYAPVEQYAEVPGMKQGAWTDVYALAAVVYWAAMGRTPPPSVGRMLSDSHEPLAVAAAGRFSTRFTEAVDRALAVHPDQRTQTIEAFRAQMGLDESPPAAVAPPPAAWDDTDATVIRPAGAGSAHPVTAAAPAVPLQTQAPPPPGRSGPAATRMPSAPAQADPTLAKPATTPAGGAAPRRSTAPWIVAAVGGVAVLAAAGWWWRAGTAPAPSLPPTTAAEPVAPVLARPAPVPEAAPAVPAPAPPAPRPLASAAEALDRLLAGRVASLGLQVRERPGKPTLTADGGASVPVMVYEAAAAGRVYVVAQREGDDALHLLAPTTAAPPAEAGRGEVDLNPLRITPGHWRAVVVLSKHPRALADAGWQADGDRWVRRFSGGAPTSADVLGPARCDAAAAGCDPSFDAAEWAFDASPAPAVAARVSPPAPQAAPAAAAAKPPAARAETARPAAHPECARILQRLSLGEMSPDLLAQLKTLKCQ